jgi:hypothetical protein
MTRPLAPRVLAPALLAAGIAWSFAVFFPGIMNWDSRYVYTYVNDFDYGDWQPPVYSVLWWVTERIAPGSTGMFLLFMVLFWSAVALLAAHVARHSPWRAVLVAALALSPPVFVILGVLWRDVFLAASWLLAVALALTSLDRPARARWLLRGAAVGLVLAGYLMRSNALFAAPLMLLYVIRPEAFSWKRAALTYVPLVAALYLFLGFVFYTVLDARRENPLHSLFVFDLGGISHFTQTNRFPVTFTPEQTKLVETGCYDPEFWDAYWTVEPCKFVMQRLEKEEKVFGTPKLREAWLAAVLSEPLAYLTHRLSYFRNLTTAHNLVLWTRDVYDPTGQRQVQAGNRAFALHRAITERLHAATPVFRPGLYGALCLALMALVWRRQAEASGALGITLGLSGAIYLVTYLPFGVASDYRYGLWTTWAALFGLVLSLRRPGGQRGSVDVART